MNMKILYLIILMMCCKISSARTDRFPESIDSLIYADTLNPQRSIDTIASDSSVYCRLTVTSEPESGQIYIDTVLTGVTPLTDHIIKKGRYKIKIINPKSPQDWQNDNQTFDLNIDKDTSINVKFSYFYFIRSNPYSARVFKDDTLLGETPLRFFREKELTGGLIIRKKNYKDFRFDLSSYNFGTGADITLIPKGLETVNDIVYKDRVTQFKTQRSLFPILGTAAISVASCIMAFNYKNIANDEYDKYLLRGNSQNLEESQNNDTYFAVSLVVMQAAVAGLIYFLFFDK